MRILLFRHEALKEAELRLSSCIAELEVVKMVYARRLAYDVVAHELHEDGQQQLETVIQKELAVLMPCPRSVLESEFNRCAGEVTGSLLRITEDAVTAAQAEVFHVSVLESLHDVRVIPFRLGIAE